ncbi:MAG: sulfur carrier protein ThiS [Deltaproteobacteria bacterium]|nr:sulfur carrier protein ThiS [Deltaproteobacteria bacterium]
MIIKINGKQENLTKQTTLSELIKDKKIDSYIIVVEYNKKIIPKEEFDKIILKDKDKLEILTFVGGG